MTKKGKIRILFICLGNICRSPAAHGVMQRLVDDSGLSGMFEIDSAGVGNWHVGDLPDARMRRHGKARGYVFDHRARQFDASTDFDRFDHIVTMDEENYRNITSMAQTESRRAQVIRTRPRRSSSSTTRTTPDSTIHPRTDGVMPYSAKSSVAWT